jgi:hypothetical protein
MAALNIFSQIYFWIRLGAQAMALEWPFYLLMAAPWLLVSCLVYVISRRWLSPRGRIFFLSGMLAGLAPCPGSHMAMFPAYLVILAFFIHPPPLLAYLTTIIPFIIVWVVFFFIGLAVATRGWTRQLGRPSPPMPALELEGLDEAALHLPEFKRVEAEEVKADEETPEASGDWRSGLAEERSSKETKRLPWRIIIPVAGILLAIMLVFSWMDDGGDPHGGPQYYPLPGTLLMQIRTVNGIKDYRFGRDVRNSAESSRSPSSSGIDFAARYRRHRNYHYDLEHELAAILSQYDLKKLMELRKRRDWRNLAKEEHFLQGPGKTMELGGQYADYFLPNKQFTKVIFRENQGVRAMLIDLESRKISFPFTFGRAENLVWDNAGRYVAYDFFVKEPKYLVVTDVITSKNRLRIPFEQSFNFWSTSYFVDDITWSPDSQYVAILVSRERMGHILPWEFICDLAGHGIVHKHLVLSIFDLSGNRLYTKALRGNFYGGRGEMVWTAD